MRKLVICYHYESGYPVWFYFSYEDKEEIYKYYQNLGWVKDENKLWLENFYIEIIEW